jgi:hypothetical protein
VKFRDIALGLAMLATFTAISAKMKRGTMPVVVAAPTEIVEKPVPRVGHPPVVEAQFGSEPGGTLVMLSLIAFTFSLLVLILFFALPHGFMATLLVFGPVSLLGLAVLFVHFRAHAKA